MRSKLQSFLVLLSKLLFVFLVPWLGFRIFLLVIDSYNRTTLLVRSISIVLFVAIVGYAIYSKIIKKYIKWLFGFWGSIVALILAYIAVAILTHDPVVPRPPTVHQLLTGYNTVYTHDGKLYQNDEYVMDLEEVFGSGYKDSLECYFCFMGITSRHGDIYIQASPLDVGGYIINIGTQQVEKFTRGIDYRGRTGPMPVAHLPKTFYNGQDLYINNRVLKNQELILSNNTGFLTHSIETVWENGAEKRYTKDYYRYSYDATGYIQIPHEELLNTIKSIPIDSIKDISFIGVLDEKPVFSATSPSDKYILQGDKWILSGQYDRAIVHDNLLYIHSGGNIYENKILVTSGIHHHYENFSNSICGFNVLCYIEGSFYHVWQAPFHYTTTAESTFQFIIGNNIPGFTLIDKGFVSTFGYTGDYKQKKGLVLVASFNKYIQTLLGYWYADIIQRNHYSRETLFKSVSDHHLKTDTIFLRPFHDSGREYSEAIPLISGIDNFLGVYPTTPPETKDPNADINIGQLIMDTYFPQEAEVESEEEVDEQALLFELLKQREVRMETSNVVLDNTINSISNDDIISQ